MVIQGKKIAAEILDSVKREVQSLPFRPLFCDVLVGEDAVSFSYVQVKGKTAESAGFEFRLCQYPSNITEAELVAEIQELNLKKNMSGIIVQLPLPAHLDRQRILDAIDPHLDVDCLGSVNAEKFYAGTGFLVPPTAAAIQHILQSLPVALPGKKIVILGQGQLVGKPLKYLLESKGLSVVSATRSTEDIQQLVQSADVLISATGQANLVTADWVKEGSVVIDAGTAEIDGGIVGDIQTSSVSEKTLWISPVPGGVGPVTVAKLLHNVLLAAKRK